MATSTAGTFLKYSPLPVTTYAKLLDVVTYPDMGATPNKLDTTTLTATKYKTSILGLQELPDLTFEANYSETDYLAIVALANTTLGFQLDLGSEGTFTWQGQVAVYLNGGGVDEVRKMTITCSASTEIVFAAA